MLRFLLGSSYVSSFVVEISLIGLVSIFLGSVEKSL